MLKTQTQIIKPADLLRELPIPIHITNAVKKARQTVRNIIHGQDHRLLVIVGPCSIHDIDAALEYAELLKAAAENFADELFIVMRAYFEKPRTIVGWKGLISDPDLDGTFNINRGLQLARKLLLDLNQLGVPAGTEFLDPIISHYLSDLITWAAIGARTTESQIHRELASGLPMPVGFKNSTDGNMKIAVDAVDTARREHHHLSINQQGSVDFTMTSGNPDCHIILRGANDKTNYTAADVHAAAELLSATKLMPRLIVDCSHGNSMKHYQNQNIAAHSIAAQIKQGTQAICGVMIESNLVAGNQQLIKNNALRYGQSITDECLAWEQTVPLLNEFAAAAQHRLKISTRKNIHEFSTN